LKSGNINLLEPSGPVQACNGIAFPLPFILGVPTNFSEEGATSTLYPMNIEAVYKSPPIVVEQLGFVSNDAMKAVIFFRTYMSFVKNGIVQAIVFLRV
jgi:hypothetical protein